MFRAIANFVTPTQQRAPDTRLSGVDPTNHPKEVGTHITPEEVDTGGSRTSQLVMGDPDLRHDEDNRSSSQPESKELPRDNDAGEKTAVHNTIHSGSDDERTGRPDVPQSEENKDRFTRQEKELTQKSSSSTGEADNRESGANILPPDVVKEQAEEINPKELFLMIKSQQDTANDFQKRQEEIQRNQQEIILATVQKSIATEAKATHKLIMDREERIMEMLHSAAAKKIDWCEASDDEEISPKFETKSTDSKFEEEPLGLIKIRLGTNRPKPKIALDLAKNYAQEQRTIAGTLIDYKHTSVTLTEQLPLKADAEKLLILQKRPTKRNTTILDLVRATFIVKHRTSKPILPTCQFGIF